LASTSAAEIEEWRAGCRASRTDKEIYVAESLTKFMADNKLRFDGVPFRIARLSLCSDYDWVVSEEWQAIAGRITSTVPDVTVAACWHDGGMFVEPGVVLGFADIFGHMLFRGLRAAAAA
jgi:hypothetical protein